MVYQRIIFLYETMVLSEDVVQITVGRKRGEEVASR